MEKQGHLRTRKRGLFGGSAGFSMITGLMAAFLISLSFAWFLRLTARTHRESVVISELSQLQDLRLGLLTTMDCVSTLELQNDAEDRRSCALNYRGPEGQLSTIRLRTRDGQEIGEGLNADWRTLDGVWQFRAFCENDAIRVRAQSIEPLPGQTEITVYDDIFSDIGGMCARYLSEHPCPSDEFAIGSTNGVPLCMRRLQLVNFHRTYSVSFDLTTRAGAPSVTDPNDPNYTKSNSWNGEGRSKLVENIGHCALVNFQIEPPNHVHPYPNHSHSPSCNCAKVTESFSGGGSVTYGVDCQIFQFSPTSFQAAVSIRGTNPPDGMRVTCSWHCWQHHGQVGDPIGVDDQHHWEMYQ